MVRLTRTTRLLSVLGTVLVLGGGCKKDDKEHEHHEAKGAKAEAERCEHGVNPSICTKCNPKLIPVFQAKGDWCNEHGFPESVCPICNPDRKGQPTKKAEGKSENKDEHEELPRKVKLPDDVLKEAGVQTAPATREVLSSTLSLAGEVVADPDRSARISSPVPGRLEQVSMKEGSQVRKGDVVAVLRVPDLGRVRGSLAATTSRAKAARSNAERLKALLESRLTSEQAYLDAKAEADSLDAEARALAEQLSALGAGGEAGRGVLLSLRSPLAGTVIERHAIVGQPVPVEQVLGSIADLSEVWFLGRVFEKDLGRLREGASCEVELNAYPKEHFVGSVEYIGQQIDPVARTVTARIRLANPQGKLRVGLFGSARVAIEGERKEPRLVVPRRALVEVAGKTVVFVRQPDGEFELHEVTLGDSAPGRVQILSGIREGEQVVVEGAFTLKSAVLKGTLAEDD